jgi:hypothetical protein
MYYILTSNWIDDINDYPLSYTISYLSKHNNHIMIKNKDEITSVTSLIGEGIEKNNYTINFFITSYDIYDCYNIINDTTIIFPIKDKSNLKKDIMEKLKIGKLNKDSTEIYQVIGAVLSTINTVNGSNSQQCFSLNREYCNLIPDTCGLCLSGYLGYEYESNLPCNSIDNLAKIGYNCNSNSNCISGICDDGVCKDALKTCIYNCNTNGKCISYDNNNNVIENCYQSNMFCYVNCQCDERYYGNYCQLNINEDEDNLRNKLCTSLYDSIDNQDIDDELIIFYSSTTANILANYNELSDYGIYNCTYSLLDIINENFNIINNNNIITYVENLSNILSIASKMSLSSYSFINDITNTINKLTSKLTNDLSVEEDIKYINSNNFKLSTQVIDKIGDRYNINLPQTDLEKFNNIPTSTLSISKSSIDSIDDAYLSISISQYVMKTGIQFLFLIILIYSNLLYDILLISSYYNR